MNPIQKTAINQPEIFNYTKQVQNQLLNEMTSFFESMKETKNLLKSANVQTETIGTWLDLVRHDFQKNIDTSWHVTNYIDNQTRTITQVAMFDNIFDTLRTQRKQNLNFFQTDMPYMIQRNQDTEKTDSVIIRKINSHLEVIAEDVEKNY